MQSIKITQNKNAYDLISELCVYDNNCLIYFRQRVCLLNNTDLIGCNRFFSNTINTVCSILDLFYSFREKEKDSLLDINSKKSVDVLNKIMEIQYAISKLLHYYNNNNNNNYYHH
ncbi:hypothetical protein BCR32DRAFT_280046 [Anaeromyces robustus]|uniref:Uncharacterized protein n=1 Tax=Anaeromyces robustus TaxID=1754192 RepID=A0A1Y1X5S6_9FUNG|nr:hypothetical protein BCR32DRAFT_280046 [Anaeromyces robustus]|eukprot:ORX81008.1 hypothetical protein BCR32DRAFT_280046 [Anaeromyces robustus]